MTKMDFVAFCYRYSSKGGKGTAMFRKIRLIDAIPFTLRYDDDAETAAAAAAEAEAAAAAEVAAAAKAAKEKKTKVILTPEQQGYVNSLVAEERRKAEAKNNQLITQLETEKNKSTTSAAERSALEERIENLRAEFQSKDEIAQRESKKAIEDAKKAKEKSDAEAKEWRQKFETRNVEVDITGAAAKHKAFKVEQVLAIVKPLSRLVEVAGDDGKPTGVYQTRVKLKATDKDGNPTVLDLTAEEAIKQMTEMPEEYGNLFESTAAGGLGGSNNSRAGGKHEKEKHEMTTDEYMEQRRKEREAGKGKRR